MVPSSFKIGTSLVGMAYLGSLTTPVPAPLVDPENWAETIPLESGADLAAGPASVTWRFPLLSQAQRDQLKTFCTGASATVYIRTRTNSSTYANYQTIMRWPKTEKHDHGWFLDTIIQFDFLVAQ